MYEGVMSWGLVQVIIECICAKPYAMLGVEVFGMTSGSWVVGLTTARVEVGCWVDVL